MKSSTKIIIPLFLGLFTISCAEAQIFFNNGATIYTAPQSVVQVNGGIENNSSTSNGNIDHNGDMTVTVNSTFSNPGDVILNNNSTWQGDGIIKVEGDWVNNATFQQDLSDVRLFASNNPQQITGTVSTTFHKLRLQGTGTGANRIKTQTLDASVDSLLELNDRELATQTFTMFVLNPDPTIVTNNTTPGNEGFVSSLAPGTLSRNTNSTSAYIFPTGSSITLTRYRPVVITPTAANNETYTVRFINHDADNDGYLRTVNDGMLCTAIDTFYHAILRTGSNNTPANITLHYIVATDGTWDGMAHWRTTNTMWNDMATVNFGTSGVFTTMTRNNWLFANPGDPYILTELKPAAPVITCPGTVCANSPGNVFTATGTGTTYSWTVPNGTIQSGQGTDSILVNWSSTQGYVYVYATSSSGCPSLIDSCLVSVAPSPIAGFDTLSLGTFNTTYQFADTSQGGTTWYWNFGDPNSGANNTSTQQNPTHQYSGAGTYTVMQVVTNASGCVDTIYSIVIVDEGILIPNVFTPDGDGINDEFWIPSSGFEEFTIEIYNRWGTKLWETTASEIRWDGRSTSGQPLSDGTYYYILKAKLKSQAGPKDYSTNGYVTLIRGGAQN
ncbi:MAG: gliding motility-associated C-terminal domain-containing protein [Bacteroidota bacterium]